MASPLLVFDLSTLPPGRITAPRIVGSGFEGGSSLSGITLASDVTGGGFLAVDYTDIQVGNANRDRMLFFNRLAVALQGGIRSIVVPLLTDFTAPTATFPAISALSTFSDGSIFSDGSSFSQTPVSGAISAVGAAGDATVSLTVVGGRQLQGGEWFGVLHPTKSYRAYCVTDIDAQSVDANGNWNAVVGIRPTLRDVISVGMNVDWWRPRCLMRIKSGSDAILDISQYWYSTPSMNFVESF